MLTRIAGAVLGVAILGWIGFNVPLMPDKPSSQVADEQSAPSSSGFKVVPLETLKTLARPDTAIGGSQDASSQAPVQYPLRPVAVRVGNEEGAMDDGALEPSQPMPPPPPRALASGATSNDLEAITASETAVTPSSYHGEGANDDEASSSGNGRK